MRWEYRGPSNSDEKTAVQRVDGHWFRNARLRAKKTSTRSPRKVAKDLENLQKSSDTPDDLNDQDSVESVAGWREQPIEVGIRGLVNVAGRGDSADDLKYEGFNMDTTHGLIKSTMGVADGSEDEEESSDTPDDSNDENYVQDSRPRLRKSTSGATHDLKDTENKSDADDNSDVEVKPEIDSDVDAEGHLEHMKPCRDEKGVNEDIEMERTFDDADSEQNEALSTIFVHT